MKETHRTALLVTLSTVMGVSGAAQPVKADLAAECSQEAEHYAVPPELFDDYVAGCVVSRGGVHPSYVAEGEAILPSNPDTAIELQEGELEGGVDDAAE